MGKIMANFWKKKKNRGRITMFNGFSYCIAKLPIHCTIPQILE